MAHHSPLCMGTQTHSWVTSHSANLPNRSLLLPHKHMPSIAVFVLPCQYAVFWHVMPFLLLHWATARACAVRLAHGGRCVLDPSGGSLTLSSGRLQLDQVASFCLDGAWVHSNASCHHHNRHTLMSAGSQGMSETSSSSDAEETELC